MTPFETFLETFVPAYKKKSILLNKATWLLETTGSQDAADLRAELDTELRILTSNASDYQMLKSFQVNDPLHKREQDLLIRLFTPHQIDPKLIKKIAEKEAALSMSFASFRAEINGKTYSDNGIQTLLKEEMDVERRKKVWEGSKEIGKVVAPQILELVRLRNKAAESLGYSDYFQMQLELQEMDEKELLHTFDSLFHLTDEVYTRLTEKIEHSLKEKFQTDELGPWIWSDPFCQEDPLDNKDLDAIVEDIDIAALGTKFYDQMGIDVRPILEKSDLYVREGKSQHAFCMDMDREGDVRTLNNITSSIKWLETVLHEYGHAVYDLGVDRSLPWLLREFPHIFTTEAMALLSGRQAYRTKALAALVPKKCTNLFEKAENSLKRRQLIFSRWVLVMTYFERELYKKPEQDLNALWWDLVEKYQKVKKPKGREKQPDWAAKYHIGLAPVYYFSYLLGELFASMIEKTLEKETGSIEINTKAAGAFLQEKLFKPGSRYNWKELVQHVAGEPLSPKAWALEFARI